MIKTIRSAVICLLLLLAGVLLFSGAAKKEKKTDGGTMTLMVYMIGSDLESGSAAASKDLEEMAAAGIDPARLNVLVYTGGAKKWHSDIPSDENALFYLEEDGFTKVETFTQESMGEPENLTRFLSYAAQNYPADRFGLILWDHGNGPMIGYGMDKQYGNDSLTLTEIGEALEASPFGPSRKLSFIGFDACLMSSAELVCCVDDYADYLVASQEVEPSFGWNYAFLSACGSSSVKDLVAEITADYLDYCEDYFAEKAFFESDVTLAAMDLSYGQELEEALNQVFAKAAKDVSGDYVNLASERVRSRALGRATTGSEYDLVDVRDLMACMSERYPKQTAKVQEILDAMIVSNRTNTEGCCGCSLYYPFYNKDYYTASWKETYRQMGLFPDYLTYLSRFEQVWLGTDMRDYFEEAMVPEEDAAGTYTLQLTEEQQEHFASARYYILRRTGDELYSAVYNSPDVTNQEGLLTANFDGNVLWFKSGGGGSCIPPCKETDTVGDVTFYTLFPLFENALNGQEDVSGEMQITLDHKTGEVTVKQILGRENSSDDTDTLQGGKREQVDPTAFKKIAFMNIRASYLTRDENGNVMPYFTWPNGSWMTGWECYAADGFEICYEPVYDDGDEYFLMFDIRDVQNNEYASELLPIRLKQRPKEAEVKKEIPQVKTDSSGCTKLFEKEGVTAELLLARDVVNGKGEYLIRVRNDNTFPVRLECSSFTINENIKMPNASVWISAEPQASGLKRIPNLNRCLALQGVRQPDTLEIFSRLRDTNTDKTLAKDLDVQVRFQEDASFRAFWEPAQDALAEKQTLYENKGLRLQLEHAGYYLKKDEEGSWTDYAELTMVLTAENTSREKREIMISGLIVNGVYISAYKDTVLPPGISASFVLERYLSDLRAAGIGSISEITLLLREDTAAEEVVSCPIRLEQAGTGTKPELPETALYEDESAAVYLRQYTETPAFSSGLNCVWEVWLQNKTDRMLYFAVQDPLLDGSAETAQTYAVGAAEYAPPDALTLMKIQVSDVEEKPDLRCRICWAESPWEEEVLGVTDEISWKDIS